MSDTGQCRIFFPGGVLPLAGEVVQTLLQIISLSVDRVSFTLEDGSVIYISPQSSQEDIMATLRQIGMIE